MTQQIKMYRKNGRRPKRNKEICVHIYTNSNAPKTNDEMKCVHNPQWTTTEISSEKLNEQQKCKWHKNDESEVNEHIRSIALQKYDKFIDDMASYKRIRIMPPPWSGERDKFSLYSI